MHRFALSQQVLLFLLAGGAQLALDTLLFISSTALGLPVVAGNVLGRLGGATLGYWLNGRFTFARRERSSFDKGTLPRFAIAWLLLTALSTALVTSVSHWASLHWAWLAKPAVEGVVAVLGFVMWRRWVYR